VSRLPVSLVYPTSQGLPLWSYNILVKKILPTRFTLNQAKFQLIIVIELTGQLVGKATPPHRGFDQVRLKLAVAQKTIFL